MVPKPSYYELEQQVKELKQELAECRQTNDYEFIAHANSILMRINYKGEITFINQYGHNFFGYTKEEMLGQNVLGTIIAEAESTGRNLSLMIKDLLNNPSRYINNEHENICKDGTRVWVSWNNKAILDNANNLLEIICIGNDST